MAELNRKKFIAKSVISLLIIGFFAAIGFLCMTPKERFFFRHPSIDRDSFHLYEWSYGALLYAADIELVVVSGMLRRLEDTIVGVETNTAFRSARKYLVPRLQEIRQWADEKRQSSTDPMFLMEIERNDWKHVRHTLGVLCISRFGSIKWYELEQGPIPVEYLPLFRGKRIDSKDSTLRLP